MTEPALTKTLTDGRTATVTRTGRDWTVAIDGQPYTSGDLHKRPDPEGKGPAIWAIGSTKVLGLSDAEYDVLRAVLDAERQAWKQTPLGRRAELLADYNAAVGQAEDARAAVQDQGAPWGPVQVAEAAITRAEVALDEWDRAHPELAAEREAQRQREHEEAVRRAWND